MTRPSSRTLAVLGHEVVDRQLLHLGHHGLGLVGAGGLHRLEVVQHGAVGAGLDEGGRPADHLGEAVGEGARLRRHVRSRTGSRSGGPAPTFSPTPLNVGELRQRAR